VFRGHLLGLTIYWWKNPWRTILGFGGDTFRGHNVVRMFRGDLLGLTIYSWKRTVLKGGDKGVDAVGWLGHLGGEGGVQVCQLWHLDALVDLGHVVLSLASQRQAGEVNWLDSQLGGLGLAGWTTLGNWGLGEALLAWTVHGQVLEEGAAAGGSLVSLGNLSWLDHGLGANLSLLLELRHEVGWDRG